MSTPTAPVPDKPALPQALTTRLHGLMPSIDEQLPKDIPLAQFRAALYLVLMGDAALTECTPESLQYAVIQAAHYGMLPGRDAYIIPFRNRSKGGAREATFVPSYQGILRTLDRTAKVARAFAHAVYENDEFACDYFEKPYHRPAVTLGKPQGKLVCFYGAVIMKSGAVHVEVLTLDDIEAVKRRAPAHDSGPWVTDFVAMARKTALKRVAKYVQLTPEGEELLDHEDTRERSDIPPERHAANITALFGEVVDPTAPTPPAAPAASSPG